MPRVGRLPQDWAAWKIAGHRSASGVAALRADMVIKKGHGGVPRALPRCARSVRRRASSSLIFAALLPAGDLEDHAVAGDVVLDAHEEALAGSIEDAAGPFCVQVVERGDAHAPVGKPIVIGTVLQA